MAEEKKDEEEKKKDDKPKEDEVPQPLEEAKKINEEKKELLDREEKLQDRKEKLHAEELVGGRAKMQEPKAKSTDEDYATKFLAGEVDPLKDDGFK